MIDWIANFFMFLAGVSMLCYWVADDPSDDGTLPPFPTVEVTYRQWRMKSAYHIDPLMQRMYQPTLPLRIVP